MKNAGCIFYTHILYCWREIDAKNTQWKPDQDEAALVATSFANLVRYALSGAYYARFRLRGKLVWKSLDTDRVSVAQLRLADLLKEQRHLATRQQEQNGGKMTVGGALDIVLERIQGNPARKPRTKLNRAERIHALKRFWPGLEDIDVRNVKKSECLA